MQVVVTAAGSALGQSVLRALAARGALRRADGEPVPIRRIIAVDRVQPPGLFLDARIEYVRGDYEMSRFLARMMGTITDSVFHLAALGAGFAESGAPADLDTALLHSLDTTRALLEACGFQTAIPKLVLASTMDAHTERGVMPLDTNGVCAALCELVLLESHRRGLIDLRSVRLPCLAGDRSSAAAIALLSQLHELAAGQARPGAAHALTAVPVLGLAQAADALLQAHELSSATPESGRFFEIPGRHERLGDLLTA